MNKILFSAIILLSFAACTSTKEIASTTKEKKSERKLAKLTEVRKAVEARRFIIKVNRIYTTRGGMLELIPRSNYIIVDGEVASVSLGYVGNSFGGRAITGINFSGHTVKYEMVNNSTKNTYDISMKVARGGNTFDFYITVDQSGWCNVSVNNLNISTITYRGQVVPVSGNIKAPVASTESF
ncbi:MAG: DUF4251 domain-containing protein [Bacteroidales bacterium]